MVYNYLFDFDLAAQDIENFVDTLEKVLQLCDIWSERIQADLQGGGEASAEAPQTNASVGAFRFEV